MLKRPRARRKDGADSDSSEEDYESKPWSLKDLREKTKESIAKRRLKKKALDPSALDASAGKGRQRGRHTRRPLPNSALAVTLGPSDHVTPQAVYGSKHLRKPPRSG